MGGKIKQLQESNQDSEEVNNELAEIRVFIAKQEKMVKQNIRGLKKQNRKLWNLAKKLRKSFQNLKVS